MQYSQSYWERETFLGSTDYAIIGAGLVGLSAAIHLKKQQPQRRVLVLERGPLPIGASTRNAGFACFGSMGELLADLEKQDETAVFELIQQRFEGLQCLRSLIGDQQLDYQALGGYELFQEKDAALFEQCRTILPEFNAKIQAITGLNQTYQVADKRLQQFGFGQVQHLIWNADEGQIHTGKMMQGFLNTARQLGVEIFTGLPIQSIENTADGALIHTTAHWEIKATKVLIAVNGFAQQFLPDIALEPARNLVLVTKPIKKMPFEGCFHYDEGYVYFRNIDGRILLGGARNLDAGTEQTADFGENPLIKTALLGLLETVVLPKQKAEVDLWWSGIMGVGPQKKPIVQWVETNVAVAVRMGGMGVAIGSLVGREAAELLG